MDEIRREAQENDAHDERARKTELTADVLLLSRKAIRGDGNEHQVVNAQDDLEEDQRHQADPRLRRCEYRKIHAFSFSP